MFNRLLLVCLFVCSPFFASRVHAQMCEPSDIQSSLQYLRRISFDLRGHAPYFAELERVVAETSVAEDLIDSMLTTDAIAPTLSAFFRDLLWVNLSVPLANNQFVIQKTYGTEGFPASGDLYWNVNRSQLFRSGTTPFPCDDRPATYDLSGALTTVDKSALYGAGAVEEGYVIVHPYYSSDPSFTIKVCAFDAQTHTTSASTQVPCDHVNYAPDCGCGPDLNYCQTLDTMGPITTSFVTQAQRMFDRIVREKRPYTELLTGKSLEINGPLSHFLRYQRFTTEGVIVSPSVVGFEVPEIPFVENATWTTVTTQGRSAGILTSPFYLLKYGSDRSRANRFYNAFLCTNFQASPTGLPSPADECNNEPDLTKRCGCKDCHVKLEPLASHWGRFSERGFADLVEAEYPDLDPSCQVSNPPYRCLEFYYTYNDGDDVPPSLAPYRGTLKSLVFADDARKANVTAGPAALAEEAIASGELARCTVSKMWQRFVGRPVRTDDPVDEAAFAKVVDHFKTQGYRLDLLAGELVRLDSYRNGFLPEVSP